MAIVMQDIKKQYAGTSAPVMEHFDLTIEEGSFTVLLGPSGCGKTTALRMIAGLEEVTGGRIFIDENDVTDVDPGERNIAMVFQNYAIYPHMTVRGNIEFGLKNYQIDKEEINERVNYVLDMTGLSEYADRKPSQLSGGQRQRVALARAISKSPKAFLMDEPLSNLDAKLRIQMRTDMIQLYNRLKCTFIYVTHDQTEAMTMGTDIVVLYKGMIQQHGTPQEVYNNPSNLFVAQFIGDPGMNALRLSDGGYVGFQPRLAQFGKSENGLNLQGTVLTNEFMGHDCMITVDIGCGSIVMRRRETRKVGEQVSLFIPQENLFYFDADQNRTGTVQTGEVVSVFHVDD
ncbi:MAG: ABC transporter ATP-binding protein [Bacillota bacterium]|jgi:sn-glycerol 3-phosphate transport system ATP-binding protein|nr:ABC transporter ATP-binding protein [Bacillota bacterium]NLN94359.1 ABC transporter ATP-binding protein [Candidatus Hydrogenedens sp.]NLV70318.1 ABC transporter ATP-binding protein [Clostridiales bacterium]HPF19575.1 ABC transporter ATP-binding protein [Bacillota bacterium]